MSPFTVYRNRNVKSKASVPLLLDIQSDLLADLQTRVVVPLAPAGDMKGRTLSTLMPTFVIEGKPYVMVTPQLAGISRKELGPKVASLSQHRLQILAALDLLVSGI